MHAHDQTRGAILSISIYIYMYVCMYAITYIQIYRQVAGARVRACVRARARPEQRLRAGRLLGGARARCLRAPTRRSPTHPRAARARAGFTRSRHARARGKPECAERAARDVEGPGARMAAGLRVDLVQLAPWASRAVDESCAMGAPRNARARPLRARRRPMRKRRLGIRARGWHHGPRAQPARICARKMYIMCIDDPNECGTEHARAIVVSCIQAWAPAGIPDASEKFEIRRANALAWHLHFRARRIRGR